MLYLGDSISKLPGKTEINIVIRLFGLILAAVALESIAGGLGQLLSDLAGKSELNWPLHRTSPLCGER